MKDRWDRSGMPSGEDMARIQAGISSTMRGAIADARRGISPSASLIPNSQRAYEPATKGNGWQDATPLRGPDTRWVDAQLDAADRRDRLVAIRQQLENAEIERRLDRQNPPFKAKTEYNPLEKYDRSVPSLHRDKQD